MSPSRADGRRWDGELRAPAEVHGHARLERGEGRLDRAAHGAAPALDELARPREPQPARLARGEAALADPREQAAVVHRGEVLPPDGVRLEHVARRDQLL